MKYDKQSTEPSMAVVGGAANVLDTDPLELDPLFETVDIDALDELLRSATGTLHVSFTFAGCEVTMSADGRIRISTPDA
jgi:hypothetical protein